MVVNAIAVAFCNVILFRCYFNSLLEAVDGLFILNFHR